MPIESGERVATPNNLPPQPNPFIGREHEINEIVALLRLPHIHFVTLTGPGGTGKTRLSIQTGALLLPEFADGVYFVELAPIDDPDLVVPTIAETLGVAEKGGMSLTDALLEYIREKEMLLILDNVEQVVAAAPRLAEILAAAPRCRFIASSRQLLHIVGEAEYAVLPFAVPNPDKLPPLDQLADYPAVAIFVQRARFVKPDFALADDNAAAVVRICDELDGLPLAIELAAARIRQFPPGEMLKQLDNRLNVLTRGGRDRSQRQQTLRGLIDWSYGLLSVGEQALFGRLGVFVGGCTREAAVEICVIDNDLPLSVDDGLESLVDKNLLRRVRGVDDHSRYTYTMLKTIQEYTIYVLERLAPEGEAEMIRMRHATHFAAFVEEAQAYLNGPAQAEWVAHLDLDHDNIRASLRHAIQHNHTEMAVGMCGALWRFWNVRGHYTEGRQWLAQALALEGDVPLALRVRALNGAGNLAFSQSDYAQATLLWEECRDIWQELGDREGVGRALHGLGSVAVAQGDYGRALILLDESYKLQRETGNPSSAAKTLANMGVLVQDIGQYPRAIEAYTESVAMLRQQGDSAMVAIVLANLGEVMLYTDQYDQARDYLHESLSLCRMLGYASTTAYVQTVLGKIALMTGDYAQAAAYFSESLTLLKGVGVKQFIVGVLEGFAGLAGLTGRLARAARLYGAAQAMREANTLPLPPAEQPLYERLLAVVRERAGGRTEQLLAWRDEGRMLDMDAAIAYALADRDDL